MAFIYDDKREKKKGGKLFRFDDDDEDYDEAEERKIRAKAERKRRIEKGGGRRGRMGDRVTAQYDRDQDDDSPPFQEKPAKRPKKYGEGPPRERDGAVPRNAYQDESDEDRRPIRPGRDDDDDDYEDGELARYAAWMDFLCEEMKDSMQIG
mmetsp:Transcript_8737/g.15497  ORF Transcript_8737/g.15497 Transcript_8737/m.15497 type:complete len:151 (+) Transcript_8737:167-619(+)